MKRLLAACMALLLLALPACGQEPSEDPSVPDPPVTDTPQPPKAETREEPPAEEALPEAAAVADNRQSGEVAEGVTYDITVPQIAAGSQEAADLINEYYDNLSHKYMDLAGGEVLEQAMQSGPGRDGGERVLRHLQRRPHPVHPPLCDRQRRRAVGHHALRRDL